MSRPNFHAIKVFNKNLVGVQLKKSPIYLKSPIYVGSSILELSKLFMYDHMYNYIEKTYGNQADAQSPNSP